MKLLLAVLAVFGVSVATLGLTLRRAEKTVADKTAASGPVLVELFTSEGCSSCPPADALLAKLDSDRQVGGADVIVLEEHVDYWDHLGWKDPYSSPQWTARQGEYAEAFHNDGVYTPQMVVDGASQLVGSRERQARLAILAAAERPKARIQLEPVVVSPGQYRLKIAVEIPSSSYAGGSAQVWLAVTESALHTNVLRGENAGEDLHHAAIVRSLQSVGVVKRSANPAFAGEQAIRLNPEWKRENVRFVVFVQDKQNLRVLGAASVHPQ